MVVYIPGCVVYKRAFSSHRILFSTAFSKSNPSSINESGSEVIFKLVNNPPTVASISIAPHVPIYIRKGCLISVYNADHNKISLTQEFVNLWSNIVNYASLKPSAFHKLVSEDKSFNALISTNNSSANKQTTLFQLNLDGTADWNVWGKDSITAYESNTSLNINPSSMFKFAKFNKVKFNVIKGRGNVLLNAIGSVIKIDLKEDYDNILIDYKNLLAVSGKSQLEIHDSISNDVLHVGKEYLFRPALLPTIKNKDNKISIRLSLEYAWISIKNLKNWLYSKYSVAKYGRPVNFVKIKGPRTVLIQSFNNSFIDTTSEYLLEEPKLIEDPLPQAPRKSIEEGKNNLWYAKVSPEGRVQFRKTSNFNDTIEKINELVR